MLRVKNANYATTNLNLAMRLDLRETCKGGRTRTWLARAKENAKIGETFQIEMTVPPLDLNGEIGTADALLALRYVMGLVDLTDAQLANADADGDGSVTIIDSLLILRAAMELIPGLPYAD